MCFLHHSGYIYVLEKLGQRGRRLRQKQYRPTSLKIIVFWNGTLYNFVLTFQRNMLPLT